MDSTKTHFDGWNTLFHENPCEVRADVSFLAVETCLQAEGTPRQRKVGRN